MLVKLAHRQSGPHTWNVPWRCWALWRETEVVRNFQLALSSRISCMQLLVAQTTTSKFARTSCRCCVVVVVVVVSRYSDSGNGLNRKSRRRNCCISYDVKKKRKKKKLIDLLRSFAERIFWWEGRKTYIRIFQEIEKRFMKMGEPYVRGWKAGCANNIYCIKLIYIYGLTVGIQATIKLSRNKLRLRFQVEPALYIQTCLQVVTRTNLFREFV